MAQSIVRRAWAHERATAAAGLTRSVEWSAAERAQLLAHGSVARYSARYVHPPDVHPRLLDDHNNIGFFKVRTLNN